MLVYREKARLHFIILFFNSNSNYIMLRNANYDLCTVVSIWILSEMRTLLTASVAPQTVYKIRQEWQIFMFAGPEWRLGFVHLAVWISVWVVGGVEAIERLGIPGKKKKKKKAVRWRVRRREGGLLATCGLHNPGTNHRGTWQSEWQMNNAPIFQPPVNRPIHHGRGD